MIHDAARPLITEGLVSRVLAALDTVPGAIPALPVSDTLKRGADAMIAGTVDRDNLWRAQTPQGFHFADILAAHRQHAGARLTDDAAVAERAGLAVAIVAGDEDNVKVTTDDDLSRVQRHFAGAETRAGSGFDVHRFGPGDHVMLCGVRVPFEAGLEGHSDADVGLHALTDALLGAIAAEDIGSHFSPDDPAWRDKPSDIFLRRAGELVSESGGTITNLDVTLICEKPRIGPHRAAMTARIADILGLSLGQVSVKATTTDEVGFIGRGEGTRGAGGGQRALAVPLAVRAVTSARRYGNTGSAPLNNGDYKEGLTFQARPPIFHCVEGRHGHGEKSTRKSSPQGAHHRSVDGYVSDRESRHGVVRIGNLARRSPLPQVRIAPHQ